MNKMKCKCFIIIILSLVQFFIEHEIKGQFAVNYVFEPNLPEFSCNKNSLKYFYYDFDDANGGSHTVNLYRADILKRLPIVINYVSDKIPTKLTIKQTLTLASQDAGCKETFPSF